jgi:RHS repeat-associated protein
VATAASLASMTVVAVPAQASAPVASAVTKASSSKVSATSCTSPTAASLVIAEMLAKSCNKQVAISARQTASSQTFANPDGSLTLTSYTGPMWMPDGKGSWKDIDETLSLNQDGTASPVASPTGLVLSGAEPDSGEHTVASFFMDGSTVSLGWNGALPAPELSGSTATYASVLPGVDLQVQATRTGVEDSLVVHDLAAAAEVASVDLPLTAKGLTVVAQASGGGFLFEDSTGKVVGVTPPPVMYDSSVASAADEPTHSAEVASTLGSQDQATGRADLTLTPSTDFLDASSTQYPVVIDPTAASLYTTLTGYVSAAAPTTSETGAQDLRLGLTSGAVTRSLLSWNTSALEGATVSSATFYVWSWYSASCTADSWSLYTVGSFTSSVTWNTQPTWGALDSSSTSTLGYSSACNDGYISTSATSFFQAAATANEATAYMGIRATSETDTNSFKQMRSQNYSGGGELPYASITYTLPPGAPYNLSLNQSNWSSDGNLYTWQTKPTLYATAVDPDGDAINYQFQILSGSTVVASGTAGNTASGTPASWTDTTTLTNGTLYSFKARAADGSTWGPWTSSPTWRLVTGQPPAPVVTCTGYTANTWSAQVTGGTTCSWTESFTYMNGYSVDLDGSTSWTSTTSTTINPAPGMHTLTITPNSASNAWGTATTYNFGVGATGAMLSPADSSQTASSVTLSAASPGSYTGVTFEYRVGTSGSFVAIPNNTAYLCGCSVTWPSSTNTDSDGVESQQITWYLNRTIPDDGPVQVEAVFANSSGPTDTTPPVTVTLNRLGSGTDYGTTQVGPATVGLQSGNAALAAVDVTINSFGSTLSVSRTFNSLSPATPSIFGAGWTSGLSSSASAWTSLVNDTSYVVLTGADGTGLDFDAGTASGGVTPYTPVGPALTRNLTLTSTTSGSVTTFSLTDVSGNVTSFSNVSGSDYAPTTETTPGSASATGIVYDENASDPSYGDPVLMVAPDAASTAAPTTACPSPPSSTTWTAGCRGLSFVYSPAGLVTAIDFVYVDNSGSYHSTAVADYAYDGTNRLTSEWDPRLSTPLVNSYAYDETSTDANYGRITEVWPAQSSGSSALAPYTLTFDTTSTDANFGKVLSVSRTHSSTYGGTTATDTIDYAVPLTTAAGGPVDMDSTTVATWDQADDPTSAVAVWNGGHVPSSTPTATDYEYATVYYYDADGRQVNTATYVNGSWSVDTVEYDGQGSEIRELSAANRAAALASGSPQGTADQLDTEFQYSCDDFGTMDSSCANNDSDYKVLTATYGPAHNADVGGVYEVIRTLTTVSYDLSAPYSDVTSSGAPYMLQTSYTTEASVGATVPGSGTADARTTESLYNNGTDETGWTLKQPLKTVTDPSGLAVTNTTAYNENTSLYGGANLVTAVSQPADTSGTTAGTTDTVYYTAGTNSLITACGNKPEWANLVCETSPVAQPSDTSTIPTKTYTYDDYLNSVTETDTYGSAGTRTATYGYDAAERRTNRTVATTGTAMGATLSKTQAVYSSSSGLVTDTQTLNGSGTVTQDLPTAFDDFEQQTSYTDATGSVTTYTYNLAGSPTERANAVDTDTITFSPGGQPVTEVDSLAGTFTATYDADGTLSTETYPDGTVGTYTIDPTGVSTAVTYTNSHWASSITDSVTTNDAGDWTSQSALNAAYSYSYDNDDRVTSVGDTQAGTCTTRTYTYDSDSNRLSQDTYGAGSGGSCQATTAADTETYAYDTADRLESSVLNGTSHTYSYDTQGDTTTTPSADADGSGDLTASYFANGLLDTQTQAGVTDTYTLDSTQARYATMASSSSGITITNHYSDSGDSPSWSGSGGVWTANVIGLDASLGAQVTSTGVVTLDLVDLHGDIIATVNPASDSAPSATYTYTEFGAVEPVSSAPGTFGYLGADERSTTALGNTSLMGMRDYNPATGRFASVDPVTGGSANAYDYVDQNPVTGFDTTGTVHLAYFYWTRSWWVFWTLHWAVQLSYQETRSIALFADPAGQIADLLDYLGVFGDIIDVAINAVAGLAKWMAEQALDVGACLEFTSGNPRVTLYVGGYCKFPKHLLG